MQNVYKIAEIKRLTLSGKISLGKIFPDQVSNLEQSTVWKSEFK